MTTTRSRSKRGRFLAGTMGLLACATVTATALAGDVKSYPGSFCQMDDFINRWVDWRGLTAISNGFAWCPIIRDQTDDDGKPRVLVEVTNNTPNGNHDLSCKVNWIDEDSAAGEFRGFSKTVVVSGAGKGQAAFNDDEYDPVWPGLSPGGEGTMTFSCFLEGGDVLHQYQVDENRY